MGFSASIDKLMYWRAGAWTKFDDGISVATLRIHCDQLIISCNNKVLESFNAHGKIKGFYKGDVLILVVSATGREIRKIRFRLQSNVKACIQVLGQHFPVLSHGVHSNSTNVIDTRYRSIEEVLKQAVETMEAGTSASDNTPNEMPDNWTNFVKLCLLDPAFPQIVQRAQNILNKF